MDLRMLARNVQTAWRYRGSARDAALRVVATYSNSLPSVIGRRDWLLRFRYPEPIGGVKLLLRSNLGSDAFIHGEVFEHEYYRLPLARRPRTILDLGANAGFTIVYFSRQYPEAFLAAVEPVQENVRVLERNLAMNGVTATIIAAAADTADGDVLMQLDEKDYGHRIATERGASGATVRVEAVSVPTILRRLGWTRIGLLKVDIEGHESVLLNQNADWLSVVDAMCIEWHGDFGEEDLRRIATRHGFDEPQRLPGVWLLQRPCGETSVPTDRPYLPAQS